MVKERVLKISITLSVYKSPLKRPWRFKWCFNMFNAYNDVVARFKSQTVILVWERLNRLNFLLGKKRKTCLDFQSLFRFIVFSQLFIGVSLSRHCLSACSFQNFSALGDMKSWWCLGVQTHHFAKQKQNKRRLSKYKKD